MYAGLTMDVAVAERLLRDQVPPGPSGAIALPQAALDGLHAYTVTLALELQLVDMTGGRPGGLSSVAQSPPWLTTAEPRDYAQTRHWAHWIRTQCPVAAGYIWVSRREPAGRVVVLFDDRTPNPASALLTPDLRRSSGSTTSPAAPGCARCWRGRTRPCPEAHGPHIYRA